MKLIAAFLILFLFSLQASARKFDFKNESFATYLKGTYGASDLGGAAYNESSSVDTKSFSGTIDSSSSGEFGIIFAFSRFNLRFAAELLMPKHISDVKGYSAAGTELFNLDTKTSAITPMAYLDFNLQSSATSKFYVGAGIGYSYVKMENIYTFTSAGDTQYSPVTSFTERATGSALALQGYVGLEFLFSDNVTLAIDGGYRYLPVRRLNHQNPVRTFQGTVSKGEAVQTDSGDTRLLNLSGAYGGLAFRFYFN